MTRAWYGCLVVALGCAGCGDGGGAAVPGGSLRVENEPPAPDETVSAREVLRIGTRQGGSPASFGRITALAVGSGGRIYVADGLAQEVRVFDADGEHLRSLGGPGEGPREFSSVSGLAARPGGDLWVWDVRASRFSVFDSSGSLLRTARREWRSLASSWPGRFLADGSLMDLESEIRGLDLERTHVQEIGRSLTPLLYDDSLDTVDSLPPLEWSLTAVGGNYRVPFETGLLHAFDAAGAVWFAEPARYELVRRERDGDTTVIARLAFHGNPVSDRERDSVVKAYEERRIALDPGLVPERKPVLSALVDLGEGRVGAFPAGPGAEEGRILDVFDGAGVLRARVDLGRTLELAPRPVHRDGVLYGVHLDELDVSFVVGLTWDKAGRDR